jgi:hypothetical protein
VKREAYFPIDESGLLHAVQAVVGDELIKRGVMWYERDAWRIRFADAHQIVERHFELAICDFCNGRPVAWNVKCDSFMLASGAHSGGDWAACEACGLLVKGRQSRALLERQVAAFGEEHREHVRRLARQFWRHYAGEVVRFIQ